MKRPQCLGPLFFAQCHRRTRNALGLHNDASPVSRFVLVWRPSELYGGMNERSAYEVRAGLVVIF